MFRELAESLRQQLEEALSLQVTFAANGSDLNHFRANDDSPANDGITISAERSLEARSGPGLSLVWLGLKEFVSRRTPSAYDQTAIHVSGKLEYLAFAQGLSVLDSHDLVERLLRTCLLNGIDYALFDLTDPNWEALGVHPRPALKLLRPLTLEVAVGQATELVEKVHLRGRLTNTAVDATPASRKVP